MTLRPDEIRAWRLSIEAVQDAGGVPLGAFNWPMVLTKFLDEYEQYADRVDDAYEQGKEVGRVNGTVRLTAALSSIRVLKEAAERDELTLALVRQQRDQLASDVHTERGPAPCGDGRCYCGGCVL